MSSEPAELVPAWMSRALDRVGWKYLRGELALPEAIAEFRTEVEAHPEFADLLIRAEATRALDEYLAEHQQPTDADSA